MAAVRRTVSLHEKTVQKVAPVKVKKPRKITRRRNSNVTTTHWSDGVNKQLVKFVNESKIDASRIEVVSPTEIIIHNPRSGK